MSTALNSKQIISADLCINCPLYKEIVPIDGTCLDLELAKDIVDIQNVRIPSSAAIYTPRKKCDFFTSTEIRDRFLSGVDCKYIV